MATHFEESLQRDIDRIRGKVSEMAAAAVRSLKNCQKALEERNRTLAYSVILGDQRIDEMEKEVDRLCLEFIIRQQPVAGPLRLAYATIRINLELERVGDYAESIARQALKLTSMDVAIPVERFAEIANLCIPMLSDAVKSFVNQDAALAQSTAKTEELVDTLKSKLNRDLMKLNQESKIPFEALNSLMMIARHFERVSDQAKNICTEVVYMCTGDYNRHKGAEATRLLFVDSSNACLSQMAEAIAHSLQLPQFIFSSAGINPGSVDPSTASFLKEKGLDATRQVSKTVSQVPNPDHYHIIVALDKDGTKSFPPAPNKTVSLEWSVQDPSRIQGSPAEVKASYEASFQFLKSHIQDLVDAVIGQNAARPA